MKQLDLSVNGRLRIGFGALLLLLAVEVGYLATWVARAGEMRALQTEHIAPRARAVEELQTALLNRAIAARDYGVTRDPRYARLQEEAWSEARGVLRTLDTFDYRPEARALVTEMKSRADAYGTASDAFLDAVERRAGPDELGRTKLAATAARELLLVPVRRFDEYQQRRFAETSAIVAQAQRRMAWGLPFFALLMVGTVLVTGSLVSRAVGKPVRELASAAGALAGGDYRPALALGGASPGPMGGARPARDELRALAGAFAHAADTLQRREARVAADLELSTVLTASLDVEQLGRAALAEVVSYAGAVVGAVYLRDDAGPGLLRVASFGLGGLPATLALGEGVPGQAAAGSKTVHVREIPADAPFRIRFGFDDLPPRAILAVPIPHLGRTVGVVLLGTLREFGEEAVSFVEQGASRLGIALRNAIAHRELARVGAELQEKNEELQAQREELQAQNAELQAQREEIHSQNEELLAQRDELKAQGDELRSHGDRLQEAARALEEADRRKDEFLAKLAHELRTPLAAITHAVQLLDAHSTPELPAAGHAAIISRQARHLARLVDDLLDVSRITHGKLRLQKAPVEMGQLLRDAAESCRAFMEARQHEIAVSIGPEPLLLEGDAVRLEQVICNLLHNAAKFTAPGGRISAAAGREGGQIVVRVKDTGAGIALELLPRIFDPFTQGEPSRKVKDGLGLGLSLVRALIEMHGGQVEARSAGPGLGSEFAVRLPALARPLGSWVRPAPESSPRPIGEAGRLHDADAAERALRVLVVDDNLDLAESMSELVREWGHEVQLRRTGRGALELALASPPDVVLLDIGLSDMEGYEVARQLRGRSGPGGRMFLVALTGLGGEEDRHRSREAGFDMHMVKPAPVEELRTTLERVARRISETISAS